MTFDIKQMVVNAETGEYDEEAAVQYQEALEEQFAQSPEGIAYTAQGKDLQWTWAFLNYAMSYLGLTPPEMDQGDFDEVLFELFPQKVAVQPEKAAEVVEELRAFWTFLGRAYELPNAPELLKGLDDRATRRLERELANPANFGMAKSMVMEGRARGFDTSTEEGLNAWMHTYNAEQIVAMPRALELGAGRLPQPAKKSSSKSKEKNRRKMAKASRKQNRRR
jgi:hypothetical protein